MLSDRLTAFAMQPAVRENITARTRGIIRANLPRLEAWLHAHDSFRYLRPSAGAIAYAKVDVEGGSSALVERIREEQSVLLVPGEMFGLKKGIRFGFGFDIEHTMKGLARVDDTLEAVAAGR
jgi:aspartate/methionine/tyrosine aminotransferase